LTDTETATDTATPTRTTTAERTDTATPTEEPTTPGATTTERPTPAATVTVAPGGDLQFSPEAVTVAVGETVRWEWDASGHNVTPTGTPDGASWEGSPGDDLYDEGYAFGATLATPGVYEYKCQPHGSIGMRGSVTVEESA